MSEPYIGEIRMFGGTFAPENWLFCNGQLLSISDNDTLFSLIGTTYGGDGQSTFALPNLQSRLPIHVGNDGQGNNYPLGQMFGAETAGLNTNQLGSHTHPLVVSNDQSPQSGPGGNYLANNPQNISPYTTDTGSLTPLASNGTTAQATTNQPHANLMPYLCVNYIISLYGIYPSQS